MFFRKKRLAVAVALALGDFAWSGDVLAQARQTTPAEEQKATGPAKAPEAKPAAAGALDASVDTGIDESLDQPVDVKREAVANVEVVGELDLGRMPEENLADRLRRLPGVAVLSDDDEAEKASLRSINPDFTLILFNGHTIGGGDWHNSAPFSSSRSISLNLVPSSVISQALVYRTSQANILDGGLEGTINVTTRRPLEQSAAFAGVVSLGVAYAQLPGKSSPNLKAVLNWKNDANTLGVITQVFSERRYFRRDSISRSGYGANSDWDVIDIGAMKGITDASLAGTGLKAADLNGVRLPGSLTTEFVEGVNNRTGGLFAVQLRPSADLDLGVTGFYSKFKADNYSRMNSSSIYSMLLGKNGPFGGVSGSAPNTSSGGARVFAQIRNPVIVDEITNYGVPLKVLKSADIVFADGTTPQYIGNSEGVYRQGAQASSGFLDFDAKYRVNDDLMVKALVSTTRGIGTTARNQGLAFARYGTGISYGLNGLYDAPDMRYIGAGGNAPVLNADGSGFQAINRTASSVKAVDSENSLALDTEYTQNAGIFSSLLAGLRYANHKRELLRTAPSFKSATFAPIPADGVRQYPDNFGSELGGGNWDRTGFYLAPEALQSYISSQLKATTPEFERRVAGEIDMREKQTAAYVMQNFGGQGWSGNAGLRFVRTQIIANVVVPVSTAICPKIEPGQPAVPCAAVPGAINTAGDGSTFYDGAQFNPLAGAVYFKTRTDRTFNNLLPSLNMRVELQKDLVTRLGASRTIGRQNYNRLGSGFGMPACTASGCTVSGPDPDLTPLKANNVDLAVEWYFARRSIAALNVFASNISGYQKAGMVRQEDTIDLLDPLDNVVKPFFITSSSQQGAKIRGYELSYEQPIGGGFGIQANYRRAGTRVDDGRPMVGVSRRTANLVGYFENAQWSAELAYSYYGKYLAGAGAPSSNADRQGNVTINGVVQPVALLWGAPVSNAAFSVSYKVTSDMQISLDITNLLNPARATYRYSEQEPQELDVSGRKFYLTARYKF